MCCGWIVLVYYVVLHVGLEFRWGLCLFHFLFYTVFFFLGCGLCRCGGCVGVMIIICVKYSIVVYELLVAGGSMSGRGTLADRLLHQLGSFGGMRDCPVVWTRS
ncbi:hypothetical protein BO82DRAFT_159261 [Aspergillus uvarum CBS 121591]|uniref:Uncharacterized protein n=1 Tax=Aspergillus uvarum CBS 121591 TaxID=1448315 RepID=A0A319C315_9EURO|nr:hypothetical protein BO82DRAFT_159261 [Aspergillus uvarum CBS 121591]PYH78250.1 hypothetical protein BO82DRAFT_159261 [Aspergillus uvarum CBS 121591]